LVLQDTPLDDSRVEEALRAYVHEVDNLSDREDQKFERVEIRASRVRLFLKYLANEEERERKQFDLDRRGGIWEEPFVPGIAAQIESELTWILRRLKENRERFAEDIHIADEKADIGILDADDDEDDDSQRQ
jgi:hypothetical protein